MAAFQAIILICLNATPVHQCTQKTAIDVLSTLVHNELGCTQGWQDVIGRSSDMREVGKKAYIRTVCKRVKTR
ncbi:MAG TPA: hypothetical protein VMU82_04365 [Acetobacteraceae bacterium]|nr:hypothetical protein [Acetobacteraceae bacterium]